mgnify:FL=1
MPMAIPLIAAAGSVAAGIGAGGLIGGMMIAGGAMTGIGALTGSKKLMQFGGILSLAGGIGGMATGAWSSTANTVAGDAATAGFGGSEYGMAQNLAGRLGEGGAAASGVSGLASLPDSVAQANSAFGGAAKPLESLGGMNAAGGTGGVAPAIAAPGGVAPVSVAQQGITNAVNNLPTIANAGGGTGSGMLSSLKSSVGDAMAWAKENPRLAQAGAGLLSSGLGAYGQQEAIKTQIQLQEDAAARARARMNDSVRGVTVPIYQPRGG